LLNTINSLPEAGGEQATPIISISSNGLITATAGAKTSTHQLAFQAAKTITPSTTSQIAVSSGYYTGGNITVAGDSNLVANNIVSGKTIFGVSGTYVGSSGGDTSIEDGLVTRTVSNYTNNRVTTIGSNAFIYCTELTTVSFPAATTISTSAFAYCSGLTTISFPKATTIGGSAFIKCQKLTAASFPEVITIENAAFAYCSGLTTVSFPKATTISGNRAFGDCSKLTTVDFPEVTNIYFTVFDNCGSLTTAYFPKLASIRASAFTRCYNLKSLYLTGSSVCALANSNAFASTPIGGYSTSAGTYGSIYVPTELLTAYKTATNWTYFSSRFVGIASTSPVKPPTPSGSTVTV
jgi:hypothetical protein